MSWKDRQNAGSTGPTPSWKDRQNVGGTGAGGTGAVPSWKQRQASAESDDKKKNEEEPAWKQKLKPTGTAVADLDAEPAWKKKKDMKTPRGAAEPEQDAPWKTNLKAAGAVEKVEAGNEPSWKAAELKNSAPGELAAPGGKDTKLKGNAAGKKVVEVTVEVTVKNKDTKLKGFETGAADTTKTKNAVATTTSTTATKEVEKIEPVAAKEEISDLEYSCVATPPRASWLSGICCCCTAG